MADMHTAFSGHRKIANGPLAVVAPAVKAAIDAGESHVLVFDDKSGPNTNVVVRSRDPAKLAAAKAAVEAMLVSVKAKLKAG